MSMLSRLFRTGGPRRGNFKALGAGGFHRVAYVEWGRRANPRVLVCVHGLTRNARDFDRLAAALAGEWRVVCPDVVGRGDSDWLGDSSGYGYPQYCADMAALVAHLGVAEVDWLGTSMGGLIGMMLAARPGTPIRRLVLNDVGPFVPRAALERLRDYVGDDPRFGSMAEVEGYFRRVLAPFGPLSDEDWRHVARHGASLADGAYRLRYDPAIGVPLKVPVIRDVDLWALWDQVACPTLVLRGERSDLLLPETAREMKARGPRAELVEVPGAGHAPALMAGEQIAAVRDWLRGR